MLSELSILNLPSTTPVPHWCSHVFVYLSRAHRPTELASNGVALKQAFTNRLTLQRLPLQDIICQPGLHENLEC